MTLGSQNQKKKEESAVSASTLSDTLPPPQSAKITTAAILQPPPGKSKKIKKSRQSMSTSSSSSSSSSTVAMVTKVTYDEKWADKQETGFKDWINFTFSQALSAFSTTHSLRDGGLEGGAGLGVPVSEEEDSASGLRGLNQKRVEARIRQQMMELYRGEAIAGVMSAIDVEISEGRLALRDERDIFADLGLQETLLNFLFSYELPWLRLGLETVFGQVIALPSKLSHHTCSSEDPKWKSALKGFIFEHLLADENINSKFSKQTLMCVRHEKTMKDMLRKHLLSKFLSLVLVLDASRSADIFSMPTLFVRTAVIKSSKVHYQFKHFSNYS